LGQASKFSNDKPSSLFVQSVSDEENIFNAFGQISYNFLPLQAFSEQTKFFYLKLGALVDIPMVSYDLTNIIITHAD
jgi:hypothetical protein